MGVVYKASDPTIGRLVAIKVLILEPSKEKGVPDAREIFMREARAAGRLAHPAIVTIHDAMEDPETHASCIVMELIEGKTLERTLLESPPLSVDQMLDIIRQVAEGLEYAHRQHVIHRDLKPANILLTTDGRAKITDFGIAKITAREGTVRTTTVMGTPSYMSPEQVTGGQIDTRSDLFSLGIILFLMLTGQKPFIGDTAAVMFKIVYEDPIAPSKLNPALGPGHDYLALRCLVKNLEKRYSSARELLDDLDDVKEGRPPRSQANFPLEELRTGEPTRRLQPLTLAPAPAQGAVTAKAWKAAAIAAAAVLVAGLGIGLWQWHTRTSHPAPPATSAATSSAVGASPTPAPSTPTSASGPPKLEIPAATAPTSPPPAKPEALESRARKATKSPNKPIRQQNAASASIPARGTSTTPSPAPSPAPASESTLKESSGTAPAAAPPAPKPTSGSRAIQLYCRHDLKEGTLTIASGNQTLATIGFKGKKKRGFLGIKGGYEGMLSRSIKLPAGAPDLTVRVVSGDGSIDLSKTTPTPAASGPAPSLQILVDGNKLTASWQAASKTSP